jgi:hypothetical protein
VTFADLRQTLIDQLDEDFGFDFQAGELTLPNTDFDLGCVFKTRDQPYASAYQLKEEHFTVRIILRDISLQMPSPEVALDSTPLEAAADQILISLTALQEFVDGYFTWLRTDYHNIQRIVDVLFRLYQQNPFNTGG